MISQIWYCIWFVYFFWLIYLISTFWYFTSALIVSVFLVLSLGNRLQTVSSWFFASRGIYEFRDAQKLLYYICMRCIYACVWRGMYTFKPLSSICSLVWLKIMFLSVIFHAYLLAAYGCITLITFANHLSEM